MLTDLCVVWPLCCPVSILTCLCVVWFLCCPRSLHCSRYLLGCLSIYCLWSLCRQFSVLFSLLCPVSVRYFSWKVVSVQRSPCAIEYKVHSSEQFSLVRHPFQSDFTLYAEPSHGTNSSPVTVQTN
jgi:hypothetical protein